MKVGTESFLCSLTEQNRRSVPFLPFSMHTCTWTIPTVMARELNSTPEPRAWDWRGPLLEARQKGTAQGTAPGNAIKNQY
ncbi:hypothetical protein GSB9_03365 [Flavobacteriaceae bacterium GSB9]|nr:hypothetical protein GSB9_03365 [Flavobacteriaceae bacterium GSB9]